MAIQGNHSHIVKNSIYNKPCSICGTPCLLQEYRINECVHFTPKKD